MVQGKFFHFFIFFSLYETNRFHVIIASVHSRSKKTKKLVRTPVTCWHADCVSLSLLSLAHFDLIRDLLLNRCMAIRNPIFKWIMFLCKTQEQKNGWSMHMDKVRPRWSLIILYKSFRFAAHFEQTRMHSMDFCLLSC